MGDSSLNYDFNSLIESPSRGHDNLGGLSLVQRAKHLYPRADGSTPVYLEDYETTEAVQDVLRSECGADLTASKRTSQCSAAVLQGDDEALG